MDSGFNFFEVSWFKGFVENLRVKGYFLTQDEMKSIIVVFSRKVKICDQIWHIIKVNYSGKLTY